MVASAIADFDPADGWQSDSKTDGNTHCRIESGFPRCFGETSPTTGVMAGESPSAKHCTLY
ncbi:MAG: hypothetical protein LBF88_10240 [Planctomycetaceae bacterium]|nr:hypothetical protein [Planctomycetaceae bacterium]